MANFLVYHQPTGTIVHLQFGGELPPSIAAIWGGRARIYSNGLRVQVVDLRLWRLRRGDLMDMDEIPIDVIVPRRDPMLAIMLGLKVIEDSLPGGGVAPRLSFRARSEINTHLQQLNRARDRHRLLDLLREAREIRQATQVEGVPADVYQERLATVLAEIQQLKARLQPESTP